MRRYATTECGGNASSSGRRSDLPNERVAVDARGNKREGARLLRKIDAEYCAGTHHIAGIRYGHAKDDFDPAARLDPFDSSEPNTICPNLFCKAGQPKVGVDTPEFYRETEIVLHCHGASMPWKATLVYTTKVLVAYSTVTFLSMVLLAYRLGADLFALRRG
jgi:hypothetical protein